ncbi:hypothetical protein DH2020_003402 [Rehmannia glutinosa]|uniref:Homeobox-leucine zipper protein n=1 Tax=Rehmannia glutinosa TaxID=99300 RepID=A0ABR0XLZ3_REHGL
MEGSGVYDSNSSMANVLLRDEKIPCTSDVLDSTLSWVPNSSPSFHGILIFLQNPFSFSAVHHPCRGKKGGSRPIKFSFLRRVLKLKISLNQREKSSSLVAKELALQPRQVAIWFQNRRARYKTKVLEKEYDSLKASYDKLKADYDTLCKENENMKNEVNLLTDKLVLRENGKAKPQELCDPINPLDLQSKKPTIALEPGDSSHVFEADVSDFSQDEDDSFSRTLLPPSIFPKLEAECYDDDLQPNSCNLGFPVQDQGTWFWQY